MKRARQSHQKQERREAILAAAMAAMAEAPLHAITMNQIAARTGLAKGTLYLYFATREELFLELLRDQLHGWFWDLEAGLEGLPRQGRLEAVAGLAAGAAACRPAFQVLLGACHGMLEANLPAATSQAFQREFQARIAAVGPFLEEALPFLHRGQGRVVLVQLLALVTGWQTLPAQERPSPLPEPGTGPQELRTGVRCLLAGWRDANRRRGQAPAQPTK